MADAWHDLETLAFKTPSRTVPTHNDYAACIIKLRARVEALEQYENDRRLRECLKAIDEATPEQIRAAVAPAGSLVERLAVAIGQDDENINWVPEARAAIREVAAWLEASGHWDAADVVEQEAER